jgi:hypothetical protein
MPTKQTEHKQSTSPEKSAASAQAVNSLTKPAVPVLQKLTNEQFVSEAAIQKKESNVVQRVVANFDHLTPAAKQEAKNLFRQWRSLLGAILHENGGIVYDRPAVRVLIYQLLTDVDVTPSLENLRRFLTHINVDLLDPPVAQPVVNIVWNIPARDRAKVEAFPNFMRDLADSRNYNAANGQPGFANAHVDDTRNGQWKLQADRELRGAGSRDRLCIDVAVAANGTVTVTVKAFLENTH